MMLRDELCQVDIALIVDTTGSMGAFIQAARQQLIATLVALSSEAGLPLDVQVGLVEYRDHPPQDASFVSRVHPLTPDLAMVQKDIEGLKPEGGGDGPEAVFDGLWAACEQLSWRPHSRRLALLVGDAPPHGVGSPGDAFARGCPCGLDCDQVTARIEARNAILYAFGLTGFVDESFRRLARFTGGEYFSAGQGEAVIQRLRAVLEQEFGSLDFDRQVLAYCAGQVGWTIDGASTALDSPRGKVSASLSRLGRRGLLG